MTTVLVTALGLAAAWGQPASPPPVEQDTRYKPLVVVSVASHERLMMDVRLLLDPLLMAFVADAVGKQWNLPIDPRTLAPASLDPRRPWGLVGETDGQSFPYYGFVPIGNLDGLLAGPVAAGKLKPPVDGIYQIPFAERNWFVAQRGPWAVFATSTNGLQTTPADPAKLLGGLPNTYDLGARVYLENAPADVRQVARQWLKEGHQLIPNRELGETELDYAVRSALTNQGLGLAALLIDEGDWLEAGLSMDLRTKNTVVDLETRFRPESEMAVGLQAPGRTKTEFGGFNLPQAALSAIWTGEPARMPLHQLLTLFDSVSRAVVPSMQAPAVADFWQTLRLAMLEENVDGGAAIVTGSGGATFVIGGSVPDGEKLEKKLDALVGPSQSTGAGRDGPRWKPGGSRYQDVRLRTLLIPLPPAAANRPQAVKLFGDRLVQRVA